MPLSDYLAKNYLSADTKPSKKRKRKNADTTGLIIADDDSSARDKATTHGDDDDDGPVFVPSSASMSKQRTTWKTYGSTAPSNAEQTAADRILADAATEKATLAQSADNDDAPAIVETEDYGMDDDGAPAMSSGAKAGLQTAEQVTAQLRKKERDERRRMEEEGLDPAGKAQETIYRDASGRRIDVSMKRAELRRKAEEEERKKIEEKEASRGDVQRREKEERMKALDDAKLLSVARYADDKEMNDEMKEKERWNDPAMRFLTTSKDDGKTVKGVKSRKKMYQGASEPNRYGIKPGYRWDGVDRSNGFERKWFDARNKVASRKEAEYAWEMDE